jgi:outer membrane protein assembly factor BamB
MNAFRARSRSRVLKFSGVLLLIFGLPLLALGKVAWTIIHTQQNGSYQQQTSVLAKSSSSLPTGSDWPTYLHDPERTSSTNETILSTANASELTKIWSFHTNGAIAASATVVAGKVYIGSWDGYEYALNENTGALIWKRFLGQTNAPNCNPSHLGITSTPTVTNNVLYVGGGDSYWYALDANTGAVLWRVYTGSNAATSGHYNWSSPLIYDGYAYIGIASDCDIPLVQGGVIQVNLATHKIVTFFKGVPDGQIGGGIWSSPSVDPTTNSLFLSSGTETGPQEYLAQSLYVLDATTMKLKSYWHLPEKDAIGDSDFDTSPILFSDAKGTPLVATINKNGYLYAFNRNDVAAGPVWHQLIDIPGMCPLCEESSVSSNTFGGGRLYAAAGNTQLDTADYRGSVDALDPTTGKFLWRHGVEGAVIGSLVYVNGLIIDGAGPTIEVLNASTGTRLYSYTTGDVIYASPSVAHGMIFEGSSDGSLYALGLAQTSTPSVTDKSCPSTWLCQDIGLPAITGTEQQSGGAWNIQAGGTGITGTYDQFHFTAQKVSGDFQISAKVVSQQSAGIGKTPQVGLMVRQSSDPTSPNYSIFLIPGQGIVVQYRASFDTITIKDVQIPNASPPLYLEIQRKGDTFQAATSSDGINYVLVPGSDEVMAFPVQMYAGFAVSSANAITQTRAGFDELAIGDPTTQPTPFPSATPCPTSWTCTDIGNPGVVGAQEKTNGAWTVTGGGTDIWWAQSDELHFISQPMTGNGSVSACVSSQTGNTPYLKSGVMIRQSLDANSPYYGIYAEHDGGTDGIVVLEYRTRSGITNRQIVIVDDAVPICMKLTRVGNEFDAYLSSNGYTWKWLAGSKEVMDTPVLSTTTLVGLTVTAKDPEGKNTTVFTNVQVK